MGRKLTDNEVSVLHQACCARTTASQAWVDIVKVCLHLGAPVNEPDCIGQTPLFYAITHRQARELVPMLLEAGAYVNHPRWSDGWTALHIAAMIGAKEVTTMLLKAGADASIENERKQTPGKLAKSYGYKCLSDLIEKSPKNLVKKEKGIKRKQDEVISVKLDLKPLDQNNKQKKKKKKKKRGKKKKKKKKKKK